MKKIAILTAVAAMALSASAQQAVLEPSFCDNWSLGIDAGATTPMKGSAFFKSMRPLVGLHLQKQITPAFGLGAEGQFSINTSSWKGFRHSSTAFDASYVGAYGAVDLFNLFAGYPCKVRPFSMEVTAGAGWGHLYQSNAEDWNFFATKVGLNFNINVCPKFTIAIKPSVMWDLSDAGTSKSSASYDIHKAVFNIQAGFTYHFGGNNFNCVPILNQAEIDALNAQINNLRAQLQQCNGTNADLNNRITDLQGQLQQCLSRKPEVVKEVSVNNQLNSVRYVFFKLGSSVIGPDQAPNVEMIAAYLKNHPESKVLIRGYASKDGNAEKNIALAKARAESVKNSLINRYKVKASRIQAEGEGIGEMFSEESWNRVSICTLETK